MWSVGVKVRAGKHASGTSGAPVDLAVEAADQAGLPLMAHIDEPPPGRSEVLPRLRKGDILTHCFRPFPNAPVFGSGAVRPDMHLARERGVIFDIGHGMGSFDFDVARTMLREGLGRDVISSDVHLLSIDGPAFDMLVCMSKMSGTGHVVPGCAEGVDGTPGRSDCLSRPWPVGRRWAGRYRDIRRAAGTCQFLRFHRRGTGRRARD